MTANNLREIFTAATASFGETPEQINSGRCFKWAEIVFDKVAGSRIAGNFMHGLGHTYIEIDGVCYDAETPDGVKDWADLPFFRRIAQNEVQ